MHPLHMPGATLITRLRVYDTPTLDGQIGGTPHVHLACTEMYLVLAGTGMVEIIDKNGFQSIPITQNDALVFSAGTIHRLINPNCNLEILVIMQNSGLPERGDNIVTFNEEWLTSDEQYAMAMRVTTLQEAYQRRDRGVEGFLQLKRTFDESIESGVQKLQRFYNLAQARTMNRLEQWRMLIRQGAQVELERSLEQVNLLQQGNTHYLLNNQIAHISNNTPPLPGFCGHLNRYFDPATLHLEGKLSS